MMDLISGFVFAALTILFVPFYARGGGDRREAWLFAGVWAVGFSVFVGLLGTFGDSAEWSALSTAALAVGFWFVWGPRMFEMTKDLDWGSQYRTAATATVGLLLVLAAVDWFLIH